MGVIVGDDRKCRRGKHQNGTSRTSPFPSSRTPQRYDDHDTHRVEGKFDASLRDDIPALHSPNASAERHDGTQPRLQTSEQCSNYLLADGALFGFERRISREEASVV